MKSNRSSVVIPLALDRGPFLGSSPLQHDDDHLFENPGEILDVRCRHRLDGPALASEMVQGFFEPGDVELAVEDLVSGGEQLYSRARAWPGSTATKAGPGSTRLPDSPASAATGSPFETATLSVGTVHEDPSSPSTSIP